MPYIGKEEYREFVCTANDYTRLQPLTSIDDVEWLIQRGTLTELFKNSKPYLQQFIISSGCGMMNQFEPWYFGVAFAFCFKFCTGMPDMPNQQVGYMHMDSYMCNAFISTRLWPSFWIT